ncbi:MAG: geranylgeranylglyceryl/heptaprenylglyceryl phosphate synthase [Promethearchaeota archaeon]|nr:MAG: geranylgeranylglyceryl/heptaprenylglyceryl phosphate synthase [Candidatus Lokiarchaeota archaeon]
MVILVKNEKYKTTYEYLIEKINKEGALHFCLIDPDPLRQSPKRAAKMAYCAEESGTDGILIGGSTVFDQVYVEKTIDEIKKKVEVPIIIFPGGIANVSQKADAVFFMSLLNSEDPYFIIGQQALGSYMIKSAGIEYISMGYLIIEPGASAGWIGNARLLPRNKPKLTAAYSLAAEMFGFQMIYLEAGSGGDAIPPEHISLCSQILSIPIIAGGGIETKEDARELVNAGADIVVMGTFIEKNILKDNGSTLTPIINEIKETGKYNKKNFKKK